MKVRRFRQDDLKALKLLFARVYPQNSRLQDDLFFDWQFHSHPWNIDRDYTFFLLVDNNGAIKGFYGYVVARYIVDGKSIGGCEPVLWWTAPENSFYGLVLFEAVTNENAVQVFLDCSKQSLALFNKMKIPSIEIPRVVGILDSEVVHNLFPDIELKYLEICRQKMLAAVANIDPSNARQSETFDETDASALFNNPEIRFHLDYSPDYLKWRYQNIPLHIYRIIRIDKNDFVVYRSEPVTNSDVTVIRIVEWCVQPINLKAVLAKLISNAYKEKSILLDFFCTSREIIFQLSKYGGFYSQENAKMARVSRWFRPVSIAPPMVIAAKITDASGNAFTDFSKMYLTSGNSDGDRMK